MALLSDGLFALWTGDADITAMIATRVFPEDRTQDSPLPAVAYRQISGDHDEHLKGYTGKRDARVQVDCFGRTYTEAKGLADLLIEKTVGPLTIGGVKFVRIVAQGPRDIGQKVEGKGFVRGASVDFLITYRMA